MDDTNRPDEPVKEPVEDNMPVEGTNLDTEHELPNPLSAPELPSQTQTDAELDASLPIVRDPQHEDNAIENL